jgi:hypothetical protein
VTEAIRKDPAALKDPPRPAGMRRVRQPPLLKDLDSALKWSSFIVMQVARGNLSPQEAAAMTTALKEFRSLLDARDSDAKLAEAKKVLAEMKALRER